MTILLALAGTVLLFWLVSFTRGMLMMSRGPAVRADDDRPLPDPPPRVSICVPARNEEDALDACLESLRGQDYPDLEIVVLDDRSTDGTGEILARHAEADPRIEALRGEEPANGWYGKPNALRQAVDRADGDWLLMADADTVHAPTSVRSALGYALAEGIAGLSLTPRLICGSFWEGLVMPSVGSMLMARYSPARVNDPDDATVFGNGQYFLVRRDAYERVGGLAVARDALDEDVVFARALKGSGLGYHLAAGDTVFATRMYTGLRDMFQGFAKNAFSTMGRSLGRVILFSVATWILSLVPVTTAVASAVVLARGAATAVPPLLLWAGLGQFLVLLAMQTTIRIRAGFPAWMSLLAPLSGMVLWLMVINSAYRGLSGKGVTWKGRTYEKR